eukprot:14901716-Heterocapsa_arctica.AAC.1
MGRMVEAAPEADLPAAMPLRIVLGLTTGPQAREGPLNRQGLPEERFSSKMSLLALPKKGPGVLSPNVHRPPGPNANLPAQPGQPELLPVLLPPILL